MKSALNTLVVTLAVSLLIGDNSILAQKGAGAPPGGAQQTSAQSPGAQNTQSAGAPAGITGGSSPIESTLFSYAALDADAAAISAGIQTKVGKGSTIVLTTSNDVSAFVQWRTIIGQGEILLDRVRDAQFELNGVDTPALIAAACNTGPAPTAPPPGQLPKVGSPFISGPSDVQTAIQTIASISAVNETLAPSSGNMTDLPLLNLVGDTLKDTSTVFVPSLLTAAPLEDTDLGNGPLVNLLWDLEDERTKSYQLLNFASSRLADWQVAATNKGNTCTTTQAALAASLVAKWSAPIQNLTTTLPTIDSFEASLFSGQASSPNGNQAAQTANQPTQSATPGAMPSPPIGTSNQNQTPSPNASPTSNAPSGTTLQQILAVDLLYQQLPKDPQANGSVPLTKVHFLELHSLESGGGLLTKSNLFLGSRFSFSGGAVATFTLFDHLGKVECAGVAFSYQGYIKPEDVADAFDGSHLRTRLSSSCGGGLFKLAPHARNVQEVNAWH
jgi:hypothetical protein